MGTLQLGSVTLPDSAITETLGWVGNRGSGKTYGAKVMAEEMLTAGAQVVVLDPVDAWYGLRYGAVKGEPGLPIYVFGGAHGDVPLEAEAGKLLADVVVEQGVSAVFSMRHLAKGKQRRFVAEFAEQLYLRKGEDQYRTPVHVFFEEAHTFAPQQMMREDFTARCLGAVQDLVLQGRSSGIGVSLVTQRVAVLSKAVLELSEVLCAFRTTGPNARKALRGWFDAHDDDRERLQLFEQQLVSLGRGECWVWSPGLLGLFEQVKLREAHTFDSSATPPPGKQQARPRGSAASLDLEELGAEITATRERAVENNPKRLHARITELEEQLKKTRAELIDATPTWAVTQTVQVEVPVFDYQTAKKIEAELDGLHEYVQDFEERIVRSRDAVMEWTLPREPQDPPAPPVTVPPAARPAPVVSAPAPAMNGDGPGEKLGKAERAALTALAQHPAGLDTTRLALLAGYAPGTGAINNALGALRSTGRISPAGSNPVLITDAGRAALGSWEPLPAEGPELGEWWLVKLRTDGKLGGKAVAAHLHVIMDAWPEELTNAEVAQRAGYEPGCGASNNALGRLRTLRLIEGKGTGRARLSPALGF